MGTAQTEEAAAKALGLTPEKRRTALRGGQSLAAVAKDQKVSVDSLVKAMVRAAEAELATAVKDKKLTQVQADKMRSSLTQRITNRVNRVQPAGRPGQGPRGAERSPSAGGISGGMGSPMSSPSTVS